MMHFEEDTDTQQSTTTDGLIGGGAVELTSSVNSLTGLINKSVEGSVNSDAKDENQGWKLRLMKPTSVNNSTEDTQIAIELRGGRGGVLQDQKTTKQSSASVTVDYNTIDNSQDNTIVIGTWGVSPTEEKSSLLSASSKTKQQESPQKLPSNSTNDSPLSSATPFSTSCWTYSGPSSLTDWKIISHNLLTVTYTKSEEALPEFTNTNICRDYLSRVTGQNGNFHDDNPSCCKKATCFLSKRKKHVYQELYTKDDIENVKEIEGGIRVKGWTGTCTAVQVMLKSKIKKDDGESKPYRFEMTNISSRLSNALDSQIERSQTDHTVPLSEEALFNVEDVDVGLPSPPWKNAESLGSYEMNENLGPILTFAIPDVSDDSQVEPTNHQFKENSLKKVPPLLWKVQFPPDPSIALEAFTVLDGILDVHPDEVDENTDSREDSQTFSFGADDSDEQCGASHPTNIYINGYQSWSYTGSLNKGETQPTIAMPDFCAKAFHYGATIPPPPSQPSLDSQRKKRDVYRKKSSMSSYKSDRSGEEMQVPFHDVSHYKSDFYTCVSSNVDGNVGFQKNKKATRYSCKVDEKGGPALILGFLSQRKQYGLVTFDSDLKRVAMHVSFQGTLASRSGGIETDWAFCQIMSPEAYDEEPMVHFLNAVSAYNDAKPLQDFPPLTGWCSWYHYYEDIDTDTLLVNFKRLQSLKKKITSDLAIIDDGYMTAWGDWTSLKKKGFSEEGNSMRVLSKSITENGMVPGLWMAPFACDKHSKIAKEHPDWIIKNNEGRYANSSNCGKFFYGLDATNPAVREFAFHSVRHAVREWGYKALKLDFLYAACLDGNGKYDLSLSRAETMHLALQTVRAAAGPDIFIIGCGCPLGPAVGYVDAMRISADTGPSWEPYFPLPWWDHTNLPCLRQMIRNSTTRACLGHRWWHNDPDCMLLGDTTELTRDDVVSAATIVAMTGGMLLLSDDLTQLSADRLRIATRIYPVTGVTAVTLDLHSTSASGLPSLLRLWCTDSTEASLDFAEKDPISLSTANSKKASFSPDKRWLNPVDRVRSCVPVAKGLGTWSVVSFSNWLDSEFIVSVPISSLLPPSSMSQTSNAMEQTGCDSGYHVFAFWSSKYIWVGSNKFDDEKTISKKLGARESEIFHVKPVTPETPQYVGSDLHFTCGYEVLSMKTTTNSIDLQIRNDAKRGGFVYLYIPNGPNQINVKVNGIAIRVEVVSRTPQLRNGKVAYTGKILRVWVIIHSNGAEDDGRVVVTF